MSGQTPKLGLPFAQSGDALTEWPGVSQILATMLEANMMPATKPSSAPQSDYPLGVSVMQVGAADAVAGDWIRGESSTVVTFRRSDGLMAGQIWMVKNGGPEMLYRSGVDTWTRWVRIGSFAQPYAVEVGEYTFPASSNNASKTINFTSGRFSSAPVVVVSGGVRDAFYTATGVTSTGFSANVGPESGAGSIARRIAWQAIQMGV